RGRGGAGEPGLGVAFPLASALVFAAAVVALALPRRGAVAARAERGDWRRLLRHGPYLRLLLFSLAAYVCLQGPLTIFPLFVRARRGSPAAVSGMWVPMLLLEIPLVALSGASLGRFGARGLIAIGVVAGGVRWLACGLGHDLAWLYPVQCLHAVTVAGFILGAPLYVEAVAPGELRPARAGLRTVGSASLRGGAPDPAPRRLLQRRRAPAPRLARRAG